MSVGWWSTDAPVPSYPAVSRSSMQVVVLLGKKDSAYPCSLDIHRHTTWCVWAALRKGPGGLSLTWQTRHSFELHMMGVGVPSAPGQRAPEQDDTSTGVTHATVTKGLHVGF